MLKKSVLIIVLIGSFLISSMAFAEEKADYPVNMANRPMTLNKGMGEVGLQLGLGLNSGRAAKDLVLGLDFGYGLTEKLELGVDVTALNYGKDLQGAKFGGAAVYVVWNFLDFLGLYADVHFPGGGVNYVDSFGDQLVGINVGLPAEYTLIEDMLKLHGGIFLDVGFAKKAVAVETPQLSLEIEFGVTFSVIERLYVDLSFGADMGIRPDTISDSAVPLALTVGYTPIDMLDVYLAFAFTDLNAGADGRMMILGAAFRF